MSTVSKELTPTSASLLGFLQSGPKSGWELINAIDCSVGYFWNVTRSQVYAELKTLAKAGLVKEGAEGARGKQPYALTAAGKLAFAAFLAEEPGEELIRFPLLLSVYFAEGLPAEDLLDFLRTHRRRHEQRLLEYREIDEHAPHSSYSAFVLRFGMRYEEQVLAWLSEVEAHTRSQLAAPPKKKPKKKQ